MITFTKVSLPYGWLSNMSPHTVKLGDSVWRTAEHLFQASRFPHTSLVRQLIFKERSPMSAKFCAKSYRHDWSVQPRSDEDIDLMRMVLNLKCEQHLDLRAALMATDDAELIEDVSRRPSESGLFWGVADPLSEKRRGQNWLGKLWMEIRERGRLFE